VKLVNIPNLLTLLRMLLIPVFVLLFYAQSYLTAAIVFAVAAITDWLDGYLARKLNQSTPFGAFLDPVADKLMVVFALVLLVEQNPHWWFSLPAVVITGREIVISALREWMAEVGKRTSVAVSYVGKIKTTMQMVAITGFLLIPEPGTGTLFILCIVLLYSAAILTLWSMLLYLRAAWPEMRGS
jgi:CDP-diacylglycerol--glycerol-3-phosphate 3-phosphatidyltransferase